MVAPSTEKPAGTTGGGRRIVTRGRVVCLLLAVIVIALAAGGGWLLGEGSGVDVEAARTAGENAGWTRGTAIGGDDYPAGLATGRRITYPRTYRDSYRIAYRRAFKGSGVDVPTDDDVQVAVP
jgi:hypothetical protein